ncbi:NAD(P)-binding protein [Sphingobium sp.]|uniref:NAD(P)/FAD-dependent oxidoreductase n=1 Tax=Sphingobium sp. TaxID=1912891 RepID=UPI0025EB3CA1|nr:NAD(P)-binding protein [Sphingobium sp.]
MTLAIIGAGMAGLACADRLAEDGVAVRLFDKGRGPGGRMSTRRVETSAGTATFDHGAQYFTVRDPLFRDQVDAWAAAGVVVPWPEAGADAWIGNPAMNAPIRHMAAAHQVDFQHHVHGLQRDAAGWWVRLDTGMEGPFDAAIVALPSEQAASILGLHDLAMARVAMTARSQPCWTAMIAFDEPVDLPVDHVSGGGILSWAARNSAKPGRDGPEAWVVQANGAWSAAHLEENPHVIGPLLLDALGQMTGGAGLPPVAHLTAHRWRFAMTRGTDNGALWNDHIRLGACGDWLLGPRVELAWLSGRMLGARVAQDMTLPLAESG